MGCFWHGCPAHSSKPKTNSDYWSPKLERNKVRDREQEEALARLGWVSIRIWEHEILADLEVAVARVLSEVRSENLRRGRVARAPGDAPG